jgi:hypothetical protein
MAKIINLDKEIHTFEEKAYRQAAPIQYYIDENGCHISKSHNLDKDGYPRVHRFGKHLRMSRYVWSIANNREIPRGMLIMHTCDNPLCINPDHLRLGTHAENMQDRNLKGRCRHGSNHPHAKLNEAKVYFIKFESTELDNKELAEMFDVKPDTIKDIRRGRSWKHVIIDMKHLSAQNDSAA